MDVDFRVVAIVAAFNEADIIRQTLEDLTSQGIHVHFIDTGSTDNTVTEVEPLVGRGVDRIERMDQGSFHWEGLLRRKEELATVIDADWFIHHDADEFRESPWPSHDLKSAIKMVDRLGYNAIDFELLNFVPTHDEFRIDRDLRQAFPYYESGRSFDKLQVRCWKNTGAPVDLAASGGHEAAFDGRRVFPIRFLLRHYPIRGEEHGRRKVFQERLPRFAAGERARGWHVQYDDRSEKGPFIRDPGSLTHYDPDAIRLRLWLEHREAEAQAAALLQQTSEAQRLERERHELHTQAASLAADLGAAEARFAASEEALQLQLSAARAAARTAQADLAQLEAQLRCETARAAALEASWSWWLTRPGRRLVSMLRARRVTP